MQKKMENKIAWIMLTGIDIYISKSRKGKTIIISDFTLISASHEPFISNFQELGVFGPFLTERVLLMLYLVYYIVKTLYIGS